MNDWDYFIKSVLHTWLIYDNVDIKNHGQRKLQGMTRLGPLFRHYLNEWVKKMHQMRKGMDKGTYVSRMPNLYVVRGTLWSAMVIYVSFMCPEKYLVQCTYVVSHHHLAWGEGP